MKVITQVVKDAFQPIQSDPFRVFICRMAVMWMISIVGLGLIAIAWLATVVT